MNKAEKESILSCRAILRRFLDPVKILDSFRDVFQLGDQKYSSIYAKIRQPHEGMDIIIDELTTVEGKEKLYERFLGAVRESNHDWLVTLICLSQGDDAQIASAIETKENMEYIHKFLSILCPELESILDANEVAQKLHSKQFLNDEDIQRVKAMKNYEGNIAGVRLLISLLVRKSPGWWFEFVNIAEDSNYNHDLVDSLKLMIGNLENKNEFENGKDIKMEKGCIVGTSNIDNVAQVMDQTHRIPESDRAILKRSSSSTTEGKETMAKSVDAQQGAATSAGTSKKSLIRQNLQRALEQKEVPKAEVPHLNSLREYQKELAVKAERGENVIICAPTGSGKTLIAAKIIEGHFEKKVDGMKPKIAFFVPRVGLAKQQCDKLKSYLPDTRKIDYQVGDSQSTLKDSFTTSDIIVMTPKKMMNSLQSDEICSLKYFDLLIFDECHHTTKGEPYNEIMMEYLKLKLDKKNRRQLLPQIIGLTATPGIGNSKTDENAEENMMTLCANLDASGGIVTVLENEDELIDHTPAPTEDTVKLDECSSNLFAECIHVVIDTVIQVLFSLDFKCKIKDISKPNVLQKGSQQFDQWCQELSNKSVRYLTEQDASLSKDIQSCVAYLKTYNEALDLQYKCRAVDAVKFLKDNLHTPSYHLHLSTAENTLLEISEEAMTELETLAANPECVNKNLIKMENIIREEFRKDPDTKIMLNTLKRQYVQPLCGWINESSNLKDLHLNAQVFTGIGKGNTLTLGAGMTHNKQERIIEKFRNGETRLLVCTPEAANEGMDIVDCNLVICYDYMKNEISKMQVKGRVRKEGGRMVQVSSQAVQAKDRSNIAKYLRMMKAVRKINKSYSMDKKVYLAKLLSLQEESCLISKLKNMNKKENKQSEKSTKRYRVLCKKCSSYVCMSDEIKILETTMYICDSKDFEEKFRKKEVDHGGTEEKQEIFCLKCDHKWGIYSHYKQVIIPLLKPNAFQYVPADREASVAGETIDGRKKWDNIPIRFNCTAYGDILRHHQ